MEVHQDQVFDCEYRSYGDEIAYCCICGGRETYEELNDFKTDCKDLGPVYDGAYKTLRAGKHIFVYEKKQEVKKTLEYSPGMW